MIAAAEVGLLDTGVLVALIDRDDQDHRASVDAIDEFRGTLVTTEAVITEAMHLLARTHGGGDACLRFFIRGPAVLYPASRASLARSREIMEQYADLPADYADASLITLGEELKTRLVFSLDRRGFSVYRDRSGKAFEIRP